MNIKRAIFVWASSAGICATLAFILLIILLSTIDPAPQTKFNMLIVLGFCAVLSLLVIAGPCTVLAVHIICKADRAGPHFPNIVEPFDGSQDDVAGDTDTPIDHDDFEWCKIIVNGKEVLATDEFLSYDDLVKMAYPEGRSDLQTITYMAAWTADGAAREAGTVTPSEKIKVKPGMAFTVVFTGAA